MLKFSCKKARILPERGRTSRWQRIWAFSFYEVIMDVLRDTTPAVDDIESMSFTGNVIPHTWYHHLKNAQGRCNAIAVLILADIVYWYRPKHIIDEDTKQLISVHKKFKRDKLQNRYSSYAEKFGISIQQVKVAIYLLKEKGLITTELRTVTLDGGIKLPKVLFIEPITEKLFEITYGYKPEPGKMKQARPSFL